MDELVNLFFSIDRLILVRLCIFLSIINLIIEIVKINKKMDYNKELIRTVIILVISICSASFFRPRGIQVLEDESILNPIAGKELQYAIGYGGIGIIYISFIIFQISNFIKLLKNKKD